MNNPIRKDLTNQVFGNLTVTGPFRKTPFGTQGKLRTEWFCTCKCGNQVWRGIDALLQGRSDSCGCLRKQRTLAKLHLAQQAAAKANRKHGYASGTHGRPTRIYQVWARMKQRCTDPNDLNFKHYGGRGIKVHPEWLDFTTFVDWAFANGYTDELTLERKNVNANYCPENCCFVPKHRQQRNTRRTVRITSIWTVPDFAERNRVPYDFVWHAFRFAKEYPGAW